MDYSSIKSVNFNAPNDWEIRVGEFKSFADLKAFCNSLPAPDTNSALYTFLNKANQVSSVNYSWSSYVLKHKVEEFSKKNKINEYVSNTGFIVAAVQMGFTAKRGLTAKDNCPNWYFNISKKSIKEI